MTISITRSLLAPTIRIIKRLFLSFSPALLDDLLPKELRVNETDEKSLTPTDLPREEVGKLRRGLGNGQRWVKNAYCVPGTTPLTALRRQEELDARSQRSADKP